MYSYNRSTQTVCYTNDFGMASATISPVLLATQEAVDYWNRQFDQGKDFVENRSPATGETCVLTRKGGKILADDGREVVVMKNDALHASLARERAANMRTKKMQESAMKKSN